jgi:hypothetical protein
MTNRYHVDPALSAAALAKARERGSVSAELIVWAAVHGSLQLALRHPQYVGASRAMVEMFVRDLGLWLVEQGLLTPAMLAEAERREREFKPNLPLQGPERDS